MLWFKKKVVERPPKINVESIEVKFALDNGQEYVQYFLGKIFDDTAISASHGFHNYLANSNRIGLYTLVLDDNSKLHIPIHKMDQIIQYAAKEHWIEND